MEVRKSQAHLRVRGKMSPASRRSLGTRSKYSQFWILRQSQANQQWRRRRRSRQYQLLVFLLWLLRSAQVRRLQKTLRVLRPYRSLCQVYPHRHTSNGKSWPGIFYSSIPRAPRVIYRHAIQRANSVQPRHSAKMGLPAVV